jgi:hypothetical protein
MTQKNVIHKKSRLTPTGMLLGGLVGALVGGLVRGGFTFYNLRAGAGFGLLASLPSAGIGFLCGAIAGCFCRGWVGALLGAFLSGGVFGLFVLPVAYLFALFNAADKVGDFTWPYFVQKAIAGAIAGGIGGFVGRLIVVSENTRQQAKLDSLDD